MYPLERLLRQTENNLRRGFRAIKMKVGRPNLDEDIARVRVMRQYLGPDIPLMVDANMTWTVDKAIEAARRLAEFDLVWIEESLVPEDLEGHVRVAAESSAKIATGENIHASTNLQRCLTPAVCITRSRTSRAAVGSPHGFASRNMPGGKACRSRRMASMTFTSICWRPPPMPPSSRRTVTGSNVTWRPLDDH